MADPEVPEKAAAEAVADSEEEEEAEKPPTPKQASSTSSSSPAAGRSKGTKAAKPQQPHSFDEADYIESVQEVPFERLHLDTEGKFGQVRVLDMEKVKVIYNNLMVRKPAMLNLVTTLTLTGSPLSLLPPLPGCPDIQAAFSPRQETMSLPYGRHCHTDMSGLLSHIWSHSS